MGRKIRNAFIADPGYVLLSSDYSQIEMVWAAHRSQDPTMMSVFINGEDLHLRTTCNVFNLDYDVTAARYFGVESKKLTSPEDISWYKYTKQFQRLPCKTVGFGVLYGQTPEGLQSSLASEGIHWTIEECTIFIESKFFEVYPGLKIMLEEDYRFARRYGMICDDFGRVRLVPEAKSTLSWISSEGTRKAGNHPEQSSSQASIKIAMARLMPILNKLGPSIARALLQIHDQLIFEVKESFVQEMAGIMREEMELATPLTIPVRASSDIGYRWGDL
jgi:DNA polymerase-1